MVVRVESRWNNGNWDSSDAWVTSSREWSAFVSWFHVYGTPIDDERLGVLLGLYEAGWPEAKILRGAAEACGISYEAMRQWWARFVDKANKTCDLASGYDHAMARATS